MIQQFLDVSVATPPSEMLARLAEVLGLETPVPMAVLLRAIEDPGFATDLITCRNSPHFLAALFDDKRTLAYAPETQTEAAPLSALALSSKAAGAFTRWGKAGFSTVDAETLERRESACLACPNLKEPESLLQKMVPVAKTSDTLGARLGRSVCGLCGCVATKKIRLPTESCPGAHPTLTNLSRWREPMTARQPVEA
jgi:hypothetical protein